MPNRPFLHADIFDDNNPQLNARTFRKCEAKKTENLDGRFREAFPTMWAVAYELDKLVQAYGKEGNSDDLTPEHHAAVEEWVSMLVLYYSGAINPETVEEDQFKDEGDDMSDYDPDLWPALAGTFPGRTTSPLQSMTLLRADDDERTVVGAYYPRIVFFPSRGRSAWRQSMALRNYLRDGDPQLSWTKTFAETVRENGAQDRADLIDYLARVAVTLGGAYGTAIAKFCRARGLNLPADVRPFDDENPFAPNARWKRAIVENAEEIMAAYPLVRETSINGVKERIYYLVQGMRTESPWMSKKFGRGMPSPQLVKRRTESEVSIGWAGREIPYMLKRTENGGDVNEKVQLLADLFLDKPAYWCKQPATDLADKPFASLIEGCHKREVNSHDNKSKLLRNLCENTALILAPINAKFIEHFGYIDELGHYGTDQPHSGRRLKGVECATADVSQEGEAKEGASWTFRVAGRDGRELPILWTEVIEQSPKLPNKSVALWPPKPSIDWRIYAIRSVGEKKRESGAWDLIDENGVVGASETKSESENISVLHDPQKPCRPVALMLRDDADQLRGVFFLKLQSNVGAPDKARLGVDFGTSNTCLAYTEDREDGVPAPQTLTFSLKPAWQWGQPQVDTAGFVPFEWHGKDFYSTVLLVPKNNMALGNRSSADIEARNLFQVDIPVLHKGLAESLYTGGLEKNWNAFPDLKWDVNDENKAWRAFFLSLSLLYAHAELLFNKGMTVSKCFWTYPLAFSGGKDEAFKVEAHAVLRKVQELCYGNAHTSESHGVNESEAIALSQNVEGEGNNYVDVFIDIGGGSTDIAVYGGGRFLVQDSVEVAGRAFFSFAEESVDPSHPYAKYNDKGAKNFRENLKKLLHGGTGEFTMPSRPTGEGQAFTADMYKLGIYYSLAIGNLPEDGTDNKHNLRLGEQKIIGPPFTINTRSYQTYRSLMFYRHIISYALLQACAAVLNDPELDPRFRLVCSGNGWGLTLFAGLNRGPNTVPDAIKKEADYLMDRIKEALTNKVQNTNGGAKKTKDLEEERRRKRIAALAVSEVKLLDRKAAKTAVSHGAVKKNTKAGDAAVRMVCYTGINLDPVKVNGQLVSVDWLRQWSTEELLKGVPDKHDGLKSIEFARLTENGKPCDPLLTVFVKPQDKWDEINSVIRKSDQYEDNKELTKSPVNQLLSRVLYPRGARHFFLENMARQEKIV